MKKLDSEIEINASAERVWQLLTDFAKFPQWNPFIHRANGEATIGARLKVMTQPSGAQRSTTRPTVLKAEPNRELRWGQQFLVRGLLDVEHIFTIKSIGANRVRFTQREIFTGLLVPFRTRHHSADIRRGFREMNQALKLRAELPLSAD